MQKSSTIKEMQKHIDQLFCGLGQNLTQCPEKDEKVKSVYNLCYNLLLSLRTLLGNIDGLKNKDLTELKALALDLEKRLSGLSKIEK